MRIAFIVDPLESLKPSKDSSIAMMRASQARKHEVFAIQAGSLNRHGSGVQGLAARLQIHEGNPWYAASNFEYERLSHFDAVLMRQDPPFDLEYLYSTHLLSLAEREGARIFNRPDSIRDNNEKLGALRFPELTPETLVSKDMAVLRAFVMTHHDTILKPLDGMGGQGIFRVRKDDPNLSVILETLTRHRTETIMAQVYLPEISEGDKRILLIDGEACPYSLARIPMAGETRGNLAAGGRGVALPLTQAEQAIAAKIGPYAKAAGLLIVGLDVIGGKLTEFNVTSPTCMVEIEEQTGFSVAEKVIEALEARVASSAH